MTLLTEAWVGDFGYAPIAVAAAAVPGLVFGLAGAIAARAGQRAESTPGSAIPAVMGSMTYLILASILAFVTVFGNWQGIVVGGALVLLAAAAIFVVIRRQTVRRIG